VESYTEALSRAASALAKAASREICSTFPLAKLSCTARCIATWSHGCGHTCRGHTAGVQRRMRQ
jgi:hypothetical protein